jgi:phosphatidylglycerophosphate synthase
MQLHRTTGRPDWEYIPAPARTYWQRAAAATNGFVTPANLCSLLGLAVSIAGLITIMRHRHLTGAVLLAIGRLADLADGLIAARTGTKSPLGEIVDASIDKIVAALALCTIFVAGLAPWLIVGAIALQQTLNTIISYIARQRRVSLHPSMSGKIATALQWLTLIAFIVLGQRWHTVTFSIALVTIALSFYATIHYARHYAREARRLSTAG